MFGIIGRLINRFRRQPAPDPTPDPTPNPTPGDFDADVELQRVFDLQNQARRNSRISPLLRNAKLDAAAVSHAIDLARRGGLGADGHRGSDGSRASDRITREGYKWTWSGENVAAGQRSGQEVFKAWMQSTGHRENILRTAFRECGLAVAVDSRGGLYWVVTFAAPAASGTPRALYFTCYEPGGLVREWVVDSKNA